MNLLEVSLLTPQKTEVQVQARRLLTPGALGCLDLGYNHAPLISSLEAGVVRIEKADGTLLVYRIAKGYLQFVNNTAVVFSEQFELSRA